MSLVRGGPSINCQWLLPAAPAAAAAAAAAASACCCCCCWLNPLLMMLLRCVLASTCFSSTVALLLHPPPAELVSPAVEHGKAAVFLEGARDSRGCAIPPPTAPLLASTARGKGTARRVRHVAQREAKGVPQRARLRLIPGRCLPLLSLLLSLLMRRCPAAAEREAAVAAIFDVAAAAARVATLSGSSAADAARRTSPNASNYSRIGCRTPASDVDLRASVDTNIRWFLLCFSVTSATRRLAFNAPAFAAWL